MSCARRLARGASCTYTRAMNTTAATPAHVIAVKSICNGGSKARRAVCSCGFLGVRYAFGPSVGRTIAEATA